MKEPESSEEFSRVYDCRWRPVPSKNQHHRLLTHMEAQCSNPWAVGCSTVIMRSGQVPLQSSTRVAVTQYTPGWMY
jgi:hypothetical protein